MPTPIYNSIGLTYNTTRRADAYLAERMYNLLSPQKDKLYLDIGCGTGNYTIALAQKGLNFVGIDPSEIMLREAQSKSEQVKWLQGTVEQIPFANDHFDGALATLTLHHWQNREQGLKELHRVLKPKSKLVFFTSSPAQMEGYWLNHYFPRLIKVSGQNMPSVEEVAELAQKAGFKFVELENYFVKPNLQDLFLHAGKHDPEIYFKEEIRRGISTFAALSNKEEVEAGLKHLRSDIDSGKFKSVKRDYENDKGDYCFVVFERPKV